MILVSGTSSGLGRYLSRLPGARAYDRHAPPGAYDSVDFDTIIHCAFMTGPYSGEIDLYDFFDSNTLLTQRLAALSYRKFIYLSSVDVYPRNGLAHREADKIILTDPNTPYGVTKLLSEAIVRRHAGNHVILRVTGMLGNYIRKTTLARMLTEKTPKLTLTADTITNYVTHTDLGQFVAAALEHDLTGTYNLAASGNVTLRDIATQLNINPQYGSAFFDIGETDNTVTRQIVPGLAADSLEKVMDFSNQVRRGLIEFISPTPDQRR